MLLNSIPSKKEFKLVINNNSGEKEENKVVQSGTQVV